MILVVALRSRFGPSAMATSQIVRLEARVLGDASKHARADFVTFVKREDIALTVLDQHPV
jgi:hypothetical protein